MIIIELHNCEAKIIGLNNQKVLKEIDLILSYQIQGAQYINTDTGWDGRYRLFKKSGKFPIGLVQTVKDILFKNKIEYTITDKRPIIKYNNPIKKIKESKFEERDYQTKAIKDIIAAGSGIIRMCTGSGKSYVIASIAAHYNVKTIIYVISIDLLYQMVDTLKTSFGIDAGIIGDGICDIKEINVMTIWSAGAAFNKKLTKEYSEDLNISEKRLKNSEEIRDLVNSAKVIIADECQYCGSDTFQLISATSQSARHRFLFSGTPWREQGDDILLEAIAGKKIVDVSASYLIDRGFLVPPKIAFKKVSTMRGAGKTYPEVYDNYIVNNIERNLLAVNACKNFLESGKTILLLIRKIKHAEVISELLNEYKIENIILNGASSSDERSAAIEDIRNGKIKVVIASSIFDQGVDIPSLDVLINLGGGKSTARMLQRIGRVIRSFPGKEKALVLDFYDQAKYLRKHSEIRMNIAKTEPKFDVKVLT